MSRAVYVSVNERIYTGFRNCLISSLRRDRRLKVLCGLAVKVFIYHAIGLWVRFPPQFSFFFHKFT